MTSERRNEVKRHMYEWQKQIQMIVDEIDSCIKKR